MKDNESLKSVTYSSGHAIKFYDDSWGPLWILRDSISILGVIRARTWEDAYSIAEDEMFPEADETLDELIKEYGFRRKHVKIVLDPKTGERDARSEDYPNGKLALPFVRWETRETPDKDAWVDNELFQEAYGFRPNGPNATDKRGHGIYTKDLNGEDLRELTPALIKELELVIEIETETE